MFRVGRRESEGTTDGVGVGTREVREGDTDRYPVIGPGIGWKALTLLVRGLRREDDLPEGKVRKVRCPRESRTELVSDKGHESCEKG